VSAHPFEGRARAALTLALWLIALPVGAAASASWPTIRAIEFSGNNTTRPVTMLRELVVHVGDPADPTKIEQSRQAVLDLGLFRAVDVSQRPYEDGVVLTFTVREKWYVLPLPRVDANAEGEYAYGGQLRWNNLFGLNQTLQLQVLERKLKEPGRSGQFSYGASYSIPFVDLGRSGLFFSGGHAVQDSIDAAGNHYGETFDSAQGLWTYSLSPASLSHGWSVGAGLLWQRENTAGQFAPAPQGRTTALVAYEAYNDLRYLVYSEQGTLFGARQEYAVDGLAADYGYSRYTADYFRAWHLGSTPHQNLQFLADAGAYLGGPASRPHNAFGLGGSSRLRGYDKDFVQGDAAWYLSGEYLRPLHWNWLRLLFVAETGSAYPRLGETGGRAVYASLGLGLRLRIVWLVNVEVEGGIAMPLVDGHRLRVFAGSV
jgi:outer membrane protein assembly factor BamA